MYICAYMSALVGVRSHDVLLTTRHSVSKHPDSKCYSSLTNASCSEGQGRCAEGLCRAGDGHVVAGESLNDWGACQLVRARGCMAHNTVSACAQGYMQGSTLKSEMMLWWWWAMMQGMQLIDAADGCQTVLEAFRARVSQLTAGNVHHDSHTLSLASCNAACACGLV